MKHILLMATALMFTTAAMADDAYPRCSKTVQDHCLQDQSRARDTKGGAPTYPTMDAHSHDMMMSGHHMMGGMDHHMDGDHHHHRHHHH